MAITISGSLTISGSFASGTDIITDGLVFYMDAANKRSYSGTGTTINNLVGIKNTATIENDVAFNTDNKGYFEFDGGDDAILLGDNDIYSFGDGSNDSPFSVSTWAVINDAGGDGFSVANKGRNYQGEWQFYTSTGDKLYWVLYDDSVGSYGAWSYVITTDAVTSLEGQWINIVGTYDGRGGSDANDGLKIYINGAAVATTKAEYDTYVALENTNEPLYLMRWHNNRTAGKVATFSIHAKELSATEVLHNYLALLPRFT